MTETARDDSVAWFGKLPGHGDFIRSGEATYLLDSLDDWLNAAMTLTARETNWQASYDRAPPRYFACLDFSRGLGLAGYLQPSRDRSNRRFPFVVARTIAYSQPPLFAARCPLILSRLWQRAGGEVQALHGVTGSEIHPQRLPELSMPLEIDPAAYDAQYEDFLFATTLSAADDELREAGHAGRLQTEIGGLPRYAERPDPYHFALPGPLHHRFNLSGFWLDLCLIKWIQGLTRLSIFIDAQTRRPRVMLVPELTAAESLSALLLQPEHNDPLNSLSKSIDLDLQWTPHTRLRSVRQALKNERLQ